MYWRLPRVLAAALASVTWLKAGDVRAEEIGSFAAVATEEMLVADGDAASPSRPEPDRSARVRGAVDPEDMVGGMVSSARKRNEMVQTTPVAVSAFSSEQLSVREVRRLSDLDGLVPSLAIDNAIGSANTGRLTIRGVGQGETATGLDPAVGVYVDGVYVPRSQGQIRALFDVERVEVLRGPQGTLFGKNTIGGAINVITRKPDFELGAEASVRVGNFDRFDTRLTLNVPLVDERAAARISLASNYDDGYQTNEFLGTRFADDRLLGSRTELLLLPSSNVEVMLMGEYTKEARRPQLGKCVVVNDPAPGIVAVEGLALGAENLTAAMFRTCAEDSGRSERKFSSELSSARSHLRTTLLSSQINWEISDALSLRSITSFRDQKDENTQDLDASELDLGTFAGGGVDSDALTQEFQLTGRSLSDRLVYVVGLFALDENIDDDSDGGESLLAGELIKRGTVLGTTVIPLVEEKRKLDNQSFAVYAQVSYDLTDRLNLTAGLRRTTERKRFKKRDVSITSGIRPSDLTAFGAGTTLLEFERSERFKDLSPSASLAFEVTPTILGYASYAKGFRSGGFNGRATSLNLDTAKIDPEDLTTYEFGLKSTFLDSRLLLNGAAYYSVYNDIQRPILQMGAGDIPTVRVTNAAEARLSGAELELVALPLPTLRLESALSVFKSRYTEFESPAQPDIDDARFPGQPSYLLTFATTYDLDLGALGLLSTRAQWTHRGAQANDAADSRSIRSDKYGLLDARMGLMLPDGKTEVALFGTNLLDRVYFNNGIDASDTVGLAVRFIGPPRRYGVELSREF
jgi:iron complex outermembrane recepter protein